MCRVEHQRCERLIQNAPWLARTLNSQSRTVALSHPLFVPACAAPLRLCVHRRRLQIDGDGPEIHSGVHYHRNNQGPDAHLHTHLHLHIRFLFLSHLQRLPKLQFLQQHRRPNRSVRHHNISQLAPLLLLPSPVALLAPLFLAP